MLNILELYEHIEKSANWYTPSKIKEMRMLQYRMTQVEFAKLIGVVESTYKQWERGRRTPSSAARSLLLIAKDYPEIFMKNREKILTLFSKFS